MSQDILFTPFSCRSMTMPNRIVMAPMTRGKSPGGAPGEDVAQYYVRRALGEVGLIVTEGTGDTYQVQFYSAGFTGGGAGIYSVKIPDIDPNETIPAGTKLFPIWLVSGVYYYQPPVWME